MIMNDACSISQVAILWMIDVLCYHEQRVEKLPSMLALWHVERLVITFVCRKSKG